MEKKIKILIADDHSILRDGLISALTIDPSLEIVGEAGNGYEAIELSKQLKPDLILMDINMPELDGINASKRIKRNYSSIKILILTMYDNRQFIIDALSAGIDGYVFKMARIQELIKAVKTVYNGDVYFDPEVTAIANQINEAGLNDNNSKLVPEITPREKEIIIYTAKGNTAGEIAERLNISYSTVKNHRHNVLQKLKLKNSAELVRYAIGAGLIK